jgi:hypothetical protein
MNTNLLPLAAILAAALATGCAKHKTTHPEAPPAPEPYLAGQLGEVPYEEMIPPPSEEPAESAVEPPVDEAVVAEELLSPDLYVLLKK